MSGRALLSRRSVDGVGAWGWFLVAVMAFLVLLGIGSRAWGDLNVTLIERTPRYDYDAAKNRPEPNDLVTFHGHVINWSDATVSPEYVWKIDSVEVEAGVLVDLAGGEERVVDLDWVWVEGDHTVSLTVDPYDVVVEGSESNNTVEDRFTGRRRGAAGCNRANS